MGILELIAGVIIGLSIATFNDEPNPRAVYPTIVQEFLKHITMFIMMYISETHIQTRIGTGAIITV